MTQHPPPPTDQPQAMAPDQSPKSNAGQTTSGMAVAAMILGIIGLITSCVVIGAALGLVGLILGIISLNQTGDPPFAKKGKGFAISGIVLGGISMALGFVAPLLIGIMLPAMGAARRTARQMQNSTQLRGIQQAMVIYAQSNRGPNAPPGFYPGLDKNGNPKDLTAAGRLKILLDKDYFTPEYLINPSDSGMSAYAGTGRFTSDNFSYALLDISDQGGRRQEWADTLHSDAIVLSDRNTGSKHSPTSVWSQNQWTGGVTYNDNSTNFENTSTFQTDYAGHKNQSDDLFTSTSPHDALLIHQGK